MNDGSEDEFEVHSIEDALLLVRSLRDQLIVCERKKRTIGNRYKQVSLALGDAINATADGRDRVNDERREAWICALSGNPLP